MRKILSQVLILSLLFSTGPLGAMAAPAKKPRPAVNAQQRRIERLERLLEAQGRQMDEMRREIEGLKQQAAAPPVTAPTPTAPAEPPESGPLIDESVPPSTTTATPTTPATPTASQPASGQTLFNPQISVIGIFEARTGNDKANRFDNQISAREVEVALQAPIDPYAKADFFLTIPNGGSLELEEGYGTFLKLPLDLQAKAGKLKAAFGRNNELHTHALPQVDRPKVVETFFGEEGLNGPGIGLSSILPTPWYSELTLQALANDNDTLFSAATSTKPIYASRWTNLFDLREDLTLETGLSGAYGKTDTADLRETLVGGAHLTLKYRPLDRVGQVGVTWESEYLTATQRLPVFTPQPSPGLDADGNPIELPPLESTARRSANGWYSYLEVQPHRNWFFGARYDRTHVPLNPSDVIQGWSGLLGYRLSEANQLRLQYSSLARSFARPLRQWFLQWNFNIGPHGTHRY